MNEEGRSVKTDDAVVIVSAARTPFGRFQGSLRRFSAYELGAIVIEEVVRRAGIESGRVDEVYFGCAIEAENDDFVAPCIARQALLKAGLPPSTLSLTVERACCSSMVAVQLGYRAIKADPGRCIIAGGAESFSRVPLIVDHSARSGTGRRLSNIVIRDPLIRLGYKQYNPVAVDAGLVAIERGVTRADQDRWALESQRRYQVAEQLGKFKDEIVAVRTEDEKGQPTVFERDEFPKPYTTLEKLSQLPTVYDSPTVTAGNAPGLNDGAAAVLLMSRGTATALGLMPIAEIVAVKSVADDPGLATTVPATVIERLLADTGMTLEDLDAIEINEAFAAMPATCCRVLAGGDVEREERLRARVNVNGGAIAIGHPLAASAARLVMTLAYELRRRGGGHGIAAICGGLAQGDGVLLQAS
jgi:acetyl-CoA C-acetyltransferase